MFKRRDIPPVLLLLLLILLVMLTLSQILVVHNGRYGKNVHSMRRLQMELKEMDANLQSMLHQDIPSIELNSRITHNNLNARRVARLIHQASLPQAHESYPISQRSGSSVTESKHINSLGTFNSSTGKAGPITVPLLSGVTDTSVTPDHVSFVTLLPSLRDRMLPAADTVARDLRSRERVEGYVGAYTTNSSETSTKLSERKKKAIVGETTIYSIDYSTSKTAASNTRTTKVLGLEFNTSISRSITNSDMEAIGFVEFVKSFPSRSVVNKRTLVPNLHESVSHQENSKLLSTGFTSVGAIRYKINPILVPDMSSMEVERSRKKLELSNNLSVGSGRIRSNSSNRSTNTEQNQSSTRLPDLTVERKLSHNLSSIGNGNAATWEHNKSILPDTVNITRNNESVEDVSGHKPSSSLDKHVSHGEARVGDRECLSAANTQICYCPAVPSHLLGRIFSADDNVTDMKRELERLRQTAEVEFGGMWRPKDCLARHKLAIIIPYRDREEHLSILLAHLHTLLQRQQLDYRIYVVEQMGDHTFNKARIMNAGFVEALKLDVYQCFVFHDVDLVPEDDRNMYSCPAQPRHMSVAIDEMDYKLAYQELVGGVLSMRTEHFQRVNGYSNLYWGWGAEDDDMAYRIMYVGLKITRPPEGLARYKMIRHTKRKPSDWRKRAKLLFTGTRRFQFDGLNSLQYQLISVTNTQLYTHIIVDIGKPPKGFQ